MRKYFSIFTLLVLGLMLSQCELENPNYPVEPIIAFKEIEFVETPKLGDADTLILTIKYQDGDRDLGFDNLSKEHQEYPYNLDWYYLTDGIGDTSRITTSIIYTTDGTKNYDLLILPNGLSGKLATDKTRLLPNYGYLPLNNDPNGCLNYSLTQILVKEDDNVIDESYNVIDTLYDNPDLEKRYLLVEEPFLYQRNENHSNIFVEFYCSDDGINFIEYDLFKEFCLHFNGRFPIPGGERGTIKSGPFKIMTITPWKGEIRYQMTNTSFLAVFGDKKMKLKIKIKDQALHTSNTIETPVFTLDEIRK